MDRTVRAILILTLCYLAFGAYAFGVFLQQPLVVGESLTVQAALEPFAYLLSMIIGNLAIFRAVALRPKRGEPILNERRLLVPAIVLLMLIAFGAGLHTAGTLVEETFHSHSTSNAHADDFTYEVAFWMEEYLSHYLMMVPYVLVFFLLVCVELSREPSAISNPQKAVVAFCGAVLGVCFAIGCVESAAVDLVVIPMNLFLLAKLRRLSQRYGLALWEFPVSAYWLIGTTLMIPLVVSFRISNGWLTQPTDLGFGIAG